LFGILYAINYDNIGYIVQNSNVVLSALITWGSWFISFSNFIPISLLVTVEIVRYGQGMKLGKDELCSSKGYFTEVQTSNLNE
jgi:phospholipid-transporting ATPase